MDSKELSVELLVLAPSSTEKDVDTHHLKRLLLHELDLEEVALDEITTSSTDKLYVEDSSLKRYAGRFDLGHNVSQLSARRFAQKFAANERLSHILMTVGKLSSGAIFPEEVCAKQDIKVESFALGTFVDLNKFVEHFGSNAVECGRVIKDLTTASFEHGKGKLTLDFQVSSVHPSSPEPTKYQLTTRYQDFHSILLTPEENKKFSVYFTMNSRLLLYSAEKEEPSSQSNRNNGQQSRPTRDFWLRTQDIGSVDAEVFGKCTVLKLVLIQKSSTATAENFHGDYIREPPLCPWTLLSTLKLFLDKRYGVPMSFAFVATQTNVAELINIPDGLPFNVGYALECLFNLSYQVEDELRVRGTSARFFTLVSRLSAQSAEVVENSLYEIFNAIARNSHVRVYDALGKIYQRLAATRSFVLECQGIKKIRRAILTPTRLVLLPPYPFAESRFLRHSEPEYVMRLVVRDDNDEMLSFTSCAYGSAKGQKTFLRDAIKKPLTNGLRVYNRKYELMGSSSSQLREHGWVYYAKDSKEQTAAMIREAIGDLKAIKAVPKYMARIGLAFSQAMAFVDIEDEDVIRLPDVKGGLNPVNNEPYTFSDGVGMISPGLAKRICEKMRIPGDPPSAFQIRFKGCKGLVVVNPKVPGGKIVIRASMEKFPSHYKSLEILKYSKNRPVYLNRPLITILEQLGTPKHVMLKMQMDSLEELTKAFFDERSAAILIKSQSSLLNAIVPAEKLVNAGISILSEPFFRKALDALVKRAVMDLKQKARIKISPEKGRIMFGVMDDFGVLEYGQIYVKYSTEDKPNRVLTGEVLVTKYPCMHPGDVRKFQAVDCPELSHIRDCIVFPQKGHRPHPDEMAGSDLDGDEYSVIWDTTLYFSRANEPPMHFPSNKAEEQLRDISGEDMLDFFITFIQSNIVGIVANAHLAYADRHKDKAIDGTTLEGIFTDVCLELCRKYCINLDFAKNGHYVSLPSTDRPQIYPDFMMKHSEKPTYQSGRTLGELFRQVSLFELSLDDSSLDLSQQLEDETFNHQDMKMYTTEASFAYSKYARDLETILTQLGVDSESALLTNALTGDPKFNGRRKDSADFQDLIETMVHKLFDEQRELFSKSRGKILSDEERLAKAAAYYRVTQYQNEHNKLKPVYGLPWVAAKELIELFKRNHTINGKVSRTPEQIAIEKLNAKFETDENQTVSEKYDSAKSILENWLFCQKQLRFGVISSRPRVSGYLDEELNKCKRENYTNRGPDQQTVGSIVLTVFQSLIKRMFVLKNETDDHVLENNLVGITAIATINKIFRSKDPVGVLSDTEVDDSDVSIKTYHIAMSFDNVYPTKLRNLVNKYGKNILLKHLKEASGVTEVTAVTHGYEGNSSLLVCALGTRWTLLHLQNIITDRYFYKKSVEAISREISEPDVPRQNEGRPNRGRQFDRRDR